MNEEKRERDAAYYAQNYIIQNSTNKGHLTFAEDCFLFSPISLTSLLFESHTTAS